MRVVVDTNVLVSGMLSGASPPAEVLQLILQGELRLLLDSRIIAEYDEVTSRPRFGFDPAERTALLNTLRAIATQVIAVPFRGPLPDPEDRMFVEVALGGRADAIITGNVRHFPIGRARLGVAILTPRQCLERLRSDPPRPTGRG